MDMVDRSTASGISLAPVSRPGRFTLIHSNDQWTALPPWPHSAPGLAAGVVDHLWRPNSYTLSVGFTKFITREEIQTRKQNLVNQEVNIQLLTCNRTFLAISPYGALFRPLLRVAPCCGTSTASLVQWRLRAARARPKTDHLALYLSPKFSYQRTY